MNVVARRSLTATAAVAALAGAGLGLAPSAQAASSPFVAATTARVPAGATAVETGAMSGAAGSTNVVYGVGATGAQQTLLNLPNGEEVMSVSGDGRRIVTGTSAAGTQFRIYDLATHTVTNLPLHGASIRFTNPSGANLYVLTGTEGHRELVRSDLTGHVQVRFPGVTEHAVVPTSDGKLVWGASKGHVTLSDNATGRQLRTFALPKGFEACAPTRDWNATTAVGTCVSSNGGADEVFLFHTNATSEMLTASGSGVPVGKQAAGNGYTDAWLSAEGVVMQHEVLCGSAPATLEMGHDGRVIPIDQVTDVVGANAYGLTPVNCSGGARSFVRDDLTTMKVHTLLTPSAGRTVVAAVTNDITAGDTAGSDPR